MSIAAIASRRGARSPGAIPRNARVLYIMGQSNAAGDSTDTNDLISSWRGTQSNIYTWDSAAGKFVKMIPNTNSSSAQISVPSTGFGEEQSLMHDLYDHYHERVYIVKLAYGGYDIAHWLTGGDFKPLMEAFVPDSIQWLIDRGLTPQVLACIWIQGESDAMNGRTTAQYQSDLEDVIDNFRSLSPYVTDCPWINQALSAAQTGISGGQQAEINTAFDNTEITKDTLTLDPDDFSPTVKAGGLHYDTDTYLTLGHEHFNLMDANDLL